MRLPKTLPTTGKLYRIEIEIRGYEPWPSMHQRANHQKQGDSFCAIDARSCAFAADSPTNSIVSVTEAKRATLLDRFGSEWMSA